MEIFYRTKAKMKLNRDGHASDEMYSSVAVLTGSLDCTDF